MIKPLTIPPKKLAQSILSTDTAFKLNNILDWAGNALVTADFGSTCYAVFKNSTNTVIEIIEIDVTTISNSQISILNRGMSFDGSLVSVPTQALDWSANDTSVMLGTDAPQLWEALKNYIDAVAIASAPDALVNLKGIAKISAATAIAIGNPTISIASPAVVTLSAHGLVAGDTVKFSTTGALPTGITAGTLYYVLSTGLATNSFEISTTNGGTAIVTSGTQSGVHLLTVTTVTGVSTSDQRLLNTYATDTGIANAFVVSSFPGIVAYAAGQAFTFKAANSNTGASTINVNGLGTKTIKKGPSTDLASGDIVANSIVVIEYDGTNFQLVSNPGSVTLISSPSIRQFTAQVLLGDTSTQFTITNTTGTTYRYTYTGTGTTPGDLTTKLSVGQIFSMQSTAMSQANTGIFTVTAVQPTYVEVTNASGVAEATKALTNGYLDIGTVYVPTAGTKYITIEMVGGGAPGSAGSTNNTGNGGAAAGYLRKLLSSSFSGLQAIVGPATLAASASPNGTSAFGIALIAKGAILTVPGTASGGDINMTGAGPGAPVNISGGASGAPAGASSYFGGGGKGGQSSTQAGSNAGGNGSGGGGGNTGSSPAGGNGMQGIIIITEYFI